MLFINLYTNLLLNLIIIKYFNNHRCLLIFSDNNFDYNGEIPSVKINVVDGFIHSSLIFHYYGCQGIIIHSNDPLPHFQNFEKHIRLNLERFNRRRFLIIVKNVTQNVEKHFSKLKELEFVSDLLLVLPQYHQTAKNINIFKPNQAQEIIFDLKTHKYTGLDTRRCIFLDRWYSKNQTFLHGVNLYPDKLSNQLGRPLKMATFTYEPYSVIGEEIKEHHGSELRSGVEFGLKYNMKPVPVVNDEDYWGEIFPNWSGNGLLGNLVEDKADIGFSALYTWEICYHYLDLSKPLVRTGITCLVPAPKLAARWLTPIFSYSPKLWISVILALLSSTVILFFILNFYSTKLFIKMKHTESHFLTLATKIVLKPVLLQSLSHTEVPLGTASKTMMGLMLVLGLFLTSTYSSGLATVMTLPRYDHPINTVEDLAQSGLNWGATQDAWITSIQNAEEPIYVQIVSKFHPTPEDELRQLSETGNFGFSIERLPFENFAIGNYIKEDVIDSFHLMDQDLYWEQCVFMLRKNSVLLPLLDLFILRIFQAGLISKWQNEAVELYMNSEVQKVVKYFKHHSLERKVVALEWSHVEGAFALLAVGLSLSFAVFVLEILWKSTKRT